MIRFSLKDVLAGTGGTLITSAAGHQLFTGISIDSRTVTSGQVFLAIRGEVHDGHDFLRDAWKAGAALAVVDGDLPPVASKIPPIPLIVVKNTIRALQSLASFWRERHPIPALAVVGSVGKTTIKEMTACILSTMGPCLKNAGNLNNHIGLPFSLLGLADYHRCAVLELGSNAPGEIAMLTSILQPAAAVITRLGWAHLEGFGDPMSLVREKAAVLDALPSSGWCALNGDSQWYEELRDRANCRVVTYGLDTGEVTASEISLGIMTSFLMETPLGRARVHIRGFGRHFVENALAAAAVTLPLGISLEDMTSGLDSWQPQNGRGGILNPRPGINFIDDSYNANPLSVGTSLENLAALRSEGVTVAVLGEMKELGEYFEQGHVLVGRRVGELEVDYLVAVGPAAELICKGATESGMPRKNIFKCSGDAAAVDALAGLLTPGVWVLFKASRAARIERVMEKFLNPAPVPAEGGD